MQKAKRGISHPLSQEKGRLTSETRARPLLRCSYSSSHPPSHSSPEEKACPAEHSPLPQALLTHQQPHVEMVTLWELVGGGYGSLHLQKAKPCGSEMLRNPHSHPGGLLIGKVEPLLFRVSLRRQLTAGERLTASSICSGVTTTPLTAFLLKSSQY